MSVEPIAPWKNAPNAPYVQVCESAPIYHVSGDYKPFFREAARARCPLSPTSKIIFDVKAVCELSNPHALLLRRLCPWLGVKWSGTIATFAFIEYFGSNPFSSNSFYRNGCGLYRFPAPGPGRSLQNWPARTSRLTAVRSEYFFASWSISHIVSPYLPLSILSQFIIYGIYKSQKARFL